MKILHLLASNKYSGAEHVVIDIIQSLKNIHEFVYVSPNGSIEKVLLEKKIPFIGLKNFSYIEIYNVIRKYKPDIIHSHDYRASCISTIMPFEGRIISHIHNNNLWAQKFNLRTILYFFALKKFSKVVTVSQPVIEEFFFSNILRDKACVISNVINTKEIFYLSKQDNNSENLLSDLLFVGRLTKQKDPVHFIEIVDEIKKFKPNIKAIMVGSGELEYECRKLITNRHLESNITLVGFQSNPYIYMINSKVLLIPSLWEGFGLVALEAMLLGVPVISSSVGGLKKIVGSYNPNWLCENNNEFIDEILKILDSIDIQEVKRTLQKYAEMTNNYSDFVTKCNELYCEERFYRGKN